MATEASLRARAKYDKRMTKQVILKLNTRTDADILSWLEHKGNKQGYLKRLIREDIEREIQS